MEILKRFPKKQQTLWRGLNSAGRRAYAVTDDRDGTPVEPRFLNFASQELALKAARWADRQRAASRVGEA